jgi:Asp-tRNA(Asn)/Glu-tRNA(Gln) amidotransferase B subunit
MSKVYKVWLEIEEYDEDTESGETVPFLEIGATGDFTTPEAAREFVLALHDIGEALGRHYPTGE